VAIPELPSTQIQAGHIKEPKHFSRNYQDFLERIPEEISTISNTTQTVDKHLPAKHATDIRDLMSIRRFIN